jgi:hypothetical protein
MLEDPALWPAGQAAVTAEDVAQLAAALGEQFFVDELLRRSG